MASYADPEKLLSRWLEERLDRKVWCDLRLPHDWWATAPVALLTRAPGEGDTQLTLDAGTYDLDWYGKNADHVREWAETARGVLRLELPGFTWPSGVTVNQVQTVSAPCWAPEFEKGVFRRTAAYRIVLHGMTH